MQRRHYQLHTITTYLIARSAIAVLLVAAQPVLGFSMSGAEYRVQFDAINVGGGVATSNLYGSSYSLGDVAPGTSEGATFGVRSGYQYVLESFIALNEIPDIIMNSAIGGVSGGIANGSTTIVVTTDNTAGYQLTLSTEGSGGLTAASGTILAYEPASSLPDFDFLTDATDAHVGYTITGDNIAADFLSDGATCGAGAQEVGQCWRGLAGSDAVIATGPGSFSGDAEIELTVRVGVGDGTLLAPGTYRGTSTITAIAL